jgi:hypothetical protein
MPKLVTLTCDMCTLLRMDRWVYISVVDPETKVLAGSGSGNAQFKKYEFPFFKKLKRLYHLQSS